MRRAAIRLNTMYHRPCSDHEGARSFRWTCTHARISSSKPCFSSVEESVSRNPRRTPSVNCCCRARALGLTRVLLTRIPVWYSKYARSREAGYQRLATPAHSNESASRPTSMNDNSFLLMSQRMLQKLNAPYSWARDQYSLMAATTARE